jgi:pimeloyl-ACP methyl ester carboxylesterase
MVKQCIYDSEPYLHDQAFMDLVLRNMASDVLQFQTRTFRTLGNIFGIKPDFLRSLQTRLGEIQSPTLVVWGKQDRAFPVSHADLAVSAMPNAKLRVFDRCGHLPYLEHADEFNRLAIEFLAQ